MLLKMLIIAGMITIGLPVAAAAAVSIMVEDSLFLSLKLLEFASLSALWFATVGLIYFTCRGK